MGDDNKSIEEVENWDEIHWMRKCIENRYFSGFIIAVILMSCVSLILQRPSMPELERETLAQINMVVNFIFLAECIWKVMTYGWWKYIKSR